MKWETKRVGDVCQILNGGTPKTGVKDYWDGDIAWITPKDMGKLEDVYVSRTERRITQAGVQNSSAKLLPPGSIILSTRAPIGHLAINEVPMTTNQGCKGLVLNDKVNNKYLYYYLKSNVELLDSLGSGTTFKELAGSKLADVPLPLPPLPEQQRIVTKLDAAFAALSEAEANVERNRANARELFESYLNGVFEGREDGTRTPMLELCEAIVDCEHKTAPTQSEGYPSIRTPNIGRGELLLDGVYRVSEETYRQWSRRAIPMPGDLILAREAPAGNVAVIPDGLQPCLGQRTVLIKPKREVVRPKYLMYELLSASMQERLLDHSQGATVQHVNMKDIRALPIPKLPSLAEQDRVVNQVESIRITSKQLETTYQQKLMELEGLKKGLLGAAFRGEL
jgi:type I restriction enzyme S subunit